MNQPSNFSNYFFNPHAIPIFIVGSLILFAGIILFIANRKTAKKIETIKGVGYKLVDEETRI